jgi:hypothetical protein
LTFLLSPKAAARDGVIAGIENAEIENAEIGIEEIAAEIELVVMRADLAEISLAAEWDLALCCKMRMRKNILI